MTEFPIIQTNIWDAIWAIPVIMILVVVLKLFVHIPSKHIPFLATVLGLFISVFISHRENISAGIFMGFFYSAATLGTYTSLKLALNGYRTN